MSQSLVSAHIRAPVERVFAYLQEPGHMPDVWPSMVAVGDVRRLPDGRVSYCWTYRLGPLRLRGVSEDLEVIPDRLVVSRTHNGIESRWTWRFAPEQGGTRVTVQIEYRPSLPIIGGLVAGTLVRRSRRDVLCLLASVDARLAS